MERDREGWEDGDTALAELGRLMCDRLFRDAVVIDAGNHIEIDLTAADFRLKVVSALGEALADMRKDRLMAIVVEKARLDRRLSDLPVLADDELPPGFSSN